MDWKLLRKAYDLFVVFFVPFVQALQFEGKHNPEDADDQQSVRDHIDRDNAPRPGCQIMPILQRIASTPKAIYQPQLRVP